MKTSSDKTTKAWGLRLSLKPGQSVVCQLAAVMEKGRSGEARRISVDRFRGFQVPSPHTFPEWRGQWLFAHGRPDD